MKVKSKQLILFLSLILLVAITALSGCSSINELLKVNATAKENYIQAGNLRSEEKYEEAIEYYLKALSNVNEEGYIQIDDSEDVLKNNICNDLAEAYYQLYDLENGMIYINKALETMPNEYYEYINRGNINYSLERYDMAEIDYETSLSIETEAVYAMYGLGTVYYDTGDYEAAKDQFLEYLQYEEDDIDAILYVSDCYYYLGLYEEGLGYVNKFLNADSNYLDTYSNYLYKDSMNYKLLIAKGDFLWETAEFTEVETFYNEFISKFPEEMEPGLLLGQYYYYVDEFEIALESFLNLAKKYPQDGEVGRWILYSYEALGDYKSAEAYFQNIIEQGLETPELYTAMGYLYQNQYRYMESVPYYQEAIRLNPEDEDSYINIIYGLYWGKRYTRCIEFAKTAAELYPSSYTIPWYIGSCYYFLSNYEEAQRYYFTALELNPGDTDIIADIADNYIMLEDYVNAGEYADLCLESDTENSIAISVKESVVYKSKPMGEQMKAFIEESYLYYDGLAESNQILDGLVADNDVSNMEIETVVEDIRNPDDIFTFSFHDADFDYVMEEMGNDVEHSINGTQVYLRIYGFNTNTDNKVIEFLDEAEDSKNKTLVIDLRDNTGGLTDCANNILDILLGDCVTSVLIDRDGYTYSYYSDVSQIAFEHIYILTSEYTASASELLTLGLKTYLNNVTVIGTTTYGKGVGQSVFVDNERKLMVYLVNHYWNVREQNIMGVGIKPDIFVKSENLEDYLNKIESLESN